MLSKIASTTDSLTVISMEFLFYDTSRTDIYQVQSFWTKPVAFDFEIDNKNNRQSKTL